jgi:hypothetical protein
VIGASRRRGTLADLAAYASGTVYWIVDNCASHAGRAWIERLEGGWQNLRPVHLPIHASWRNQIELSFSIVQPKAPSPNSFDSLAALADRPPRLGEHDRQIARPFDWTITRADPERVLAKITEPEPRLALTA